MFEALAGEIEQLDIPPDGDAIAEAVTLRDRLEARIAEAVGTFDAAELWDLDAATSMTAWQRSNAGMTGKDAARTASAARRLRDLPVTAAAWRSGELSRGQVDAVLGHLDATTTALFADHEAEVVPSLVSLSVAETSRAMAWWKEHASAVCERPEPGEPDNALHLSRTFGGRRVIDGTLDPLSGEVVAAALRSAETDDGAGERPRAPAERRADALVDVCRFFLDHRGGRHRPHLNVVVNLDDLLAGRGGSAVDGAPLDGAAVQALLCDSALHRVLFSRRSAVLDYGTATRTVPASLWNALVVRDEHCRFPGCDRQASWCEGHHVVAVTEGGPPAWTTWCWRAPATTTACTNAGGRPSSTPTAPSRWSTPPGGSAPPPRPGRGRWRRRKLLLPAGSAVTRSSSASSPSSCPCVITLTMSDGIVHSAGEGVGRDVGDAREVGRRRRR